jgi:hypothetical protein
MALSVFPPHRPHRAELPQWVPQVDSLLWSAVRLSAIGHTSRVLCLAYVALYRYVYLFAPSLRRVSWPLLSEALRFPAFVGTMGAYDCSPTLPCHLWSPLAAGTPRRGPVRFPWDTLVSLGTWFFSGWAEPHPARERSEALLGSREVLLKACPGLGTPATPEQPRTIGCLDAAFRCPNGVGVTMMYDVGAEPSRPASLLCTLRTRRSPDERQHSLPVCPLRL